MTADSFHTASLVPEALPQLSIAVEALQRYCAIQENDKYASMFFSA